MAMYHDLDPKQPGFPNSDIVRSLLAGSEAAGALPFAEEYEVDEPEIEAKVPCHANDPHEEHDFGVFEADGQTIFFKIDLYEEPEVKDSNGEPIVNRVLTIMLAEEY
jgi:hypothetical protein